MIKLGMNGIKIFISAKESDLFSKIVKEKDFTVLKPFKDSVERTIAQIEESDALIFDYSEDVVDSLLQIIKGVELKRQILILIPESNAKGVNPFLKNLDKKLVEIKLYSEENLKSQISKYIKDLAEKLGLQRYNVVLGHKHKKYLDWASQIHGSSRSEIIRYALDYLISADQGYKAEE